MVSSVRKLLGTLWLYQTICSLVEIQNAKAIADVLMEVLSALDPRTSEVLSVVG